ncbi:MAG: DNA-directed RNA polymerase sigma-70 factor [Chitinophagales bacterium]|nr:MAG: DNA-directed RNA polymerase sigma-70 factor [Chitinophagales bacterium]
MRAFSPQDFNEKELINGCLIGDRNAQKALYDKYAAKMFAICLRYAKDYHSAEDVLQEGFIKVFKYIGNFRHEGSFEGWLRRIFINTSIEFLRKSISLYPIVDEEDKPMDIVDESVFDELDHQDLIAMVQSLSPGYRTVFNLYVIEGYSHKEIAKILGINEGTSKSQLARARMIIQKKLAESTRTAAKSIS